MSEPLPLPAMLSVAFVAFVIEADNAAELAVAHHMTSAGRSDERGALWMASLAMWFNCLGPLQEAGELTVVELERIARTTTNLDGVRRWGYITVDGIGRVRRGSGSRPRPKRSSVLALTARGEAAEAVWRELPAVIETRWCERFGAAPIKRLREALVVIAQRSDVELPDFMPIAGIERSAAPQPRPVQDRAVDAELRLVSLLARVLLQFTLAYERDTRLRLGSWANVLRVLEDAASPVPVRELPRLAGVAKESQAAIIGRLERNGVVALEPLQAAARGRQARLTSDRGVHAAAAGRRRLTTILDTFDAGDLPASLAPITGDGTREGSPLWAGLQPPANGWRARAPEAHRLPWYPLLTHRGGYPDGS